MDLVTNVDVSAPNGSTELAAGTSKTSSNANASRISMFHLLWINEGIRLTIPFLMTLGLTQAQIGSKVVIGARSETNLPEELARAPYYGPEKVEKYDPDFLHSKRHGPKTRAKKRDVGSVTGSPAPHAAC
jgi:hypothetical protein